MGNCGTREEKPPGNVAPPTRRDVRDGGGPVNGTAKSTNTVGSDAHKRAPRQVSDGQFHIVSAKSREGSLHSVRRRSAGYGPVNLKLPPVAVERPPIGMEVVIYGQRGSNAQLNGARGTIVGYDSSTPQVRVDGSGNTHRVPAEWLLGSTQEIASFYSDESEVRFFCTYTHALLRWVQPPLPAAPMITPVLALSFRHSDRLLRDQSNMGTALGVGDWRRVVNLLAPVADRCGVGHNLPTREIRVDGWWRAGAAVTALWEEAWHPGHVSRSQAKGEVDILWDEDESLTPGVLPGHVRPWMRADCVLQPDTQEVAHEPSLLYSPHLDFNDIYATGSKLGEGGFGEVYEVVHKESKIRYAAKVLPVSHGTKDEVREVIAGRREPVVIGTKVQSLAYQDLDAKAVAAACGSSSSRRGDSRTRNISGFVVYVGPCHYGETGWVGVVLDVALGSHNGTVDGVRYFDAPHNRGAFVKSTLCRPVRPHVTEVWGGLNHPSICRLVDWRAGRHAFTLHGYPDWKNEEVYGPESENYMVCVMAHCPGGDLETLLKSPSFKHIFIGENAAAMIMKQILGGLDHLHSKGILHHDLKVSNVLLDEAYSGGAFMPSIKLCDFGLSRYIGDGEVGGGTLLYMAPELLLAWRWRPNTKWSRAWKEAAAMFGVKRDISKEPPSYDHKIDIFAAGVVCYSVMTRGRRHPFRLEASWANLPESEHLLHLADSIIKGVQFPDVPWGRVSDDCKSFISMLLCANSADRPTAAEAMRHPWILKNTPSTRGGKGVQETLWQDQQGSGNLNGNGNSNSNSPTATSPRDDAGSLGVVSKFKNMKLREAPQGKGPPKGLPLRRDTWRRGAAARPVNTGGKLAPSTTQSARRIGSKRYNPQGGGSPSGSPHGSPVNEQGFCTPAYQGKPEPKHETRLF